MSQHQASTVCAFADLLRTARQRANLTQQALATATKLPRSLISELENARSIIRLAHAQALAGRLAVTTVEYKAMLACVDPTAGTRRWGPRTGITAALEQEVLANLNAGLSDREAAEAVGLAPGQVSSVRRLHGQAALPRGERTARQFAHLDQQIIADYRAGMSWSVIVQRYDIPRSTLYELLARHQVPLQQRSVRLRKRR
jgi:transcriptional regulator with XRE-family HTH domain